MVGLALRPRFESSLLLLRKKLKIGDELLARCCLAAPSPRKLEASAELARAAKCRHK